LKEIRNIIAKYDATDHSTEKLALASVVNVEESSYRRIGARMLVSSNGQWIGGISGGCLEGDALKRSQKAIFKNESSRVVYDTMDDDKNQIGVGALMFLGGLINSRRKNLKLGKQKIEIEKQKDLIETNRDLIGKEKEKSDALLLNILPKETAAELKAHGSAKPQHYAEVSVLFTDFSNFTSLSEGLSAEDLIQELNKHFLAFDDICQKYNIEKIKTIGDSYMCASGLPQKSKTHAKDIILAAIDMQNFVSKNNISRKKQNLKLWEMRAGIHTGPIIAGVEGSTKFSYDIWGDTVNTASRMESSGQVGEINISASTYAIVKDDFKCTFRGKVAAKHKGELDMYFVEF